MFRKIVLLIFVLFIAGCIGGGGGGGSSGVGGGGGNDAPIASWTPFSSSNPDNIDLANSYRTAEYKEQWGLTTINAAEAYASLSLNGKAQAGLGVKIGDADTGINAAHLDIAANLSPTGNWNYDGNNNNVADINGHGTFTASIMAAVAGNGGMQGVAYNATLVVAKIGDGPSYQVMADAAKGFASQGVKAMNLSYGDNSGNSQPDILGGAMLDMINSVIAGDMVLAVSAGNSGHDNPSSPARFASNPQTKGYEIAVGAVDKSGSLSSFSNLCGDAMNYCMVAPGSSIEGASSVDNYGYNGGNGTSYSAPFVTAAAAVLRAAWPQLSAPQTVQILLNSATYLPALRYETKNIGTAANPIYVNAVTGHGLLNLHAAVEAKGQNLISSAAFLSPSSVSSLTVTSAGYDVRSSSIVTDPIFGDAFRQNIVPQLSSAVFFDDYGRDYKANLGNNISNKRTTNYTAAMASNYDTKNIPLRFTKNGFVSEINLQIKSYKDPNMAKFIIIDKSQEDKTLTSANGLSFMQNFSKGFKAGFAFNTDQATNIRNDNFGFMSMNSLSASPFQSFVTNQTSSSLNQKSQKNFNQIFVLKSFFDQKFAVNFLHQTSYQNSALFAKSNTPNNEISDLGFTFLPAKEFNFTVSLGNLNEFNNNFLNSQALGAFGSAGTVKTSYVKFSATKKLFDGLSVISSFAEGSTIANGNSQGIFRSYSNIQSRSSAIGLVTDKFLDGNIGAIYLQPMRVYSGSASINVPTGVDASGNIIRYSSNVSLKPKGKEQDFEIFFSKKINSNSNSNLKLNFITQKQPGNIKDAKTSYFWMGSYSKKF